MTANHREPRAIEVAGAFPLRFEERLFLGATDSFLQIEADGHTGRAAGRDVEPLLFRNRRGDHRLPMFEQILLREQRTLAQIIRALQ